MEYSWLVAEVRMNNKTDDEKGFSSGIDRAITDMPDDFVIKPFLEAHRAEVKELYYNCGIVQSHAASKDSNFTHLSHYDSRFSG